MKMPNEIVEELQEIWKNFLKESYPNVEQKNLIVDVEDIKIMERDYLEGGSDYNQVLESSSEKYGRTAEEKIEFWIKVFKGQYNLFFELKKTTVIVDGQTFII